MKGSKIKLCWTQYKINFLREQPHHERGESCSSLCTELQELFKLFARHFSSCSLHRDHLATKTTKCSHEWPKNWVFIMQINISSNKLLRGDACWGSTAEVSNAQKPMWMRISPWSPAANRTEIHFRAKLGLNMKTMKHSKEKHKTLRQILHLSLEGRESQKLT